MFECLGLKVKEVKEFLKVAKKLKPPKDIDKLYNMMISNNGNETTFEVTDLETSVIHTFENITATNDTILINYQTLSNVLKTFKKGQMAIYQVDDSNATLVIDGTKLNIKINEMLISDFPNVRKISNCDECIKSELDPKTFFNRVKRVLVFASKDDFMRNLYGIFFENQTMIGADGFKMAIQKVPEMQFDDVFLLSTPSMKVLQSAKKLFNDRLALLYDGKLTAFQDNKTIITCRVVDADFPDWRKVIPSNYHTTMTLNDDLVPILKIAQSANDTDTVIINLNGNAVIQSKTVDRTVSFEKELPATKTGNDLKVAYNPKFLLDIFKNADIQEMKFVDKNSPALAVGNDNDKYIVMPIRLDD